MDPSPLGPGVKIDAHLPIFGLFRRQIPSTSNLKRHQKWFRISRNRDFDQYVKNFKNLIMCVCVCVCVYVNPSTLSKTNEF